MPKPILRIPHWRDFQHYKDRSAPWIKSYRELLLDDQWHELSDLSKAHLFGLWLLAANYEGKIPFKPSWITKQICATSAINWRELAESKWVALNADASEVLAELLQDASLRALAREEGEGEGEKEGDSAKPRGQQRSEVSEDYEPPVELVEKACRELHLSVADVRSAIPKFVSFHRAKGNRFKRVDLAFWNWISNRFVDAKSKPSPTLSFTPSHKAE